MRHRRLLFLMVALLSFWLGCSDKKDYSGFHRFLFEQRPGLGFCPDPAMVYKATLERSGPDEITFSATMLQAQSRAEQEEEEAQPCSTGIEVGSDCMEEVELMSGPLSSEQRDLVRSVFAGIVVEPSPEARCRTVAIDPCRILSFQWDDTEHTDYVCSSNRLEAPQAETITDLINTLRGGG